MHRRGNEKLERGWLGLTEPKKWGKRERNGTERRQASLLLLMRRGRGPNAMVGRESDLSRSAKKKMEAIESNSEEETSNRDATKQKRITDRENKKKNMWDAHAKRSRECENARKANKQDGGWLSGGK